MDAPIEELEKLLGEASPRPWEGLTPFFDSFPIVNAAGLEALERHP